MPDQPRRADPPAWVLLAVLTIIAIVLAFPDIGRLHSSVAGNSGDSLLNLWIMRSVQTGLVRSYAFTLVAGAAVLAVYFLTKANL